MDSVTVGLRELHNLHLQLQDVTDELARGPRMVQARRKRLENQRQELQAEKARLTDLRKSADAKSLQLKSNEEKLVQLRAKLNAAQSNREFDIIKSEIEADTMANSVLEDEILETLDRVDGVQTDIAAIENRIAEYEREVDEFQSEVEAAHPGLEARAAELQTQIKAAENVVPAMHREKYRRLVQAHGAGALASVDNRACSACNAVISSQLRVDLNVGKIVFCRSCGRLLYLDQSD